VAQEQPESPDYVPRSWSRSRFNRWFDRSPTRVLAFYALMGAIGVALIAQAIVDPSGVHGGLAVRALVGAVLFLPLIFVYAPRAWKARQANRGGS
jgi:hypothetical protein